MAGGSHHQHLLQSARPKYTTGFGRQNRLLLVRVEFRLSYNYFLRFRPPHPRSTKLYFQSYSPLTSPFECSKNRRRIRKRKLIMYATINRVIGCGSKLMLRFWTMTRKSKSRTSTVIGGKTKNLPLKNRHTSLDRLYKNRIAYVDKRKYIFS